MANRVQEVAMSTVYALALKERQFMDERIYPLRDFFDRVVVPKTLAMLARFDGGGWPTRDAAEPGEEC